MRAFQSAQEHLVAFERLAEQTADVHRQFLEGQQRIQQTFVRLLEEEQRVARGFHDSAKPFVAAGGTIAPSRRPFPHTAREVVPQVALPVSSDLGDRNGTSDAAPTLAQTGPLEPNQADSQPAAQAASEVGAIADTVIGVVADKTGYPPEVLGLDLKLDADLGIDSIKRVEIFSAIQDRLPGLLRATPEQVGALGTLREIVAFLRQDDLPQPSAASAGIAATTTNGMSKGAAPVPVPSSRPEQTSGWKA